jgi:YVTN family beta-propeller protein
MNGFKASLFVLWMAAGLGAADASAQPRAYIATCVGLSVVDVTTNELITTVPAGSSPFAVAITPDGSRAYVTSGLLSGPLSIIDSVSNSVIATNTSIDCPRGIAFTPRPFLLTRNSASGADGENSGRPPVRSGIRGSASALSYTTSTGDHR